MKRLVLVAAAAVLAAVPAFAGSLSLPGLSAGSIEVQSWSWGTSNARETGTGMATGRRQYEPIRFIKQIDKTSPVLDEACKSGRTFPQATVGMNGKVYKLTNVKLINCSSAGGTQTITITLTEVLVSS